MYRDYDLGTVDVNIVNDGLKTFLSFLIGIWFFILIIAVFMIIVKWKVYKKAGKEGWESIIPIYNNWVFFEISGMEGWYSLLVFIPVLGSIINFVFHIIACIKLSKCFGKDPAFAIGLIFLPVVFFPILAFDKSEYKLIKDPVINI